jgi:hypothetical protein
MLFIHKKVRNTFELAYEILIKTKINIDGTTEARKKQTSCLLENLT